MQLFGAGGPEAFVGVVEVPDIEVACGKESDGRKGAMPELKTKGSREGTWHTNLRSFRRAYPHNRPSRSFPCPS